MTRAWGVRGSIEVVKRCALVRTNCATLNVKSSVGHPQICAALVWNFRRWTIVLRLYLSAL